MKKSELRKFIINEIKKINEDNSSVGNIGNSSVDNNIKPDTNVVIKLMQNNKSLMQRLQNINTGSEIDDLLDFILSHINDKTSSVNLTTLLTTLKTHLKPNK